MFTHLHVHTEYSLLDGMCQIPQLIARAKDLGMGSLAITDHGALYGVISFYLEAKEAGIKPIIGCEVYVAPNRRQSRNAADKNHYHLVLLAENEAGYRNLLKLSTRAQLEGFYYKPRVDKELLTQYHEGLIALSACPSGEVGRLILEGRLADAEKAALDYKAIFGKFYLELQGHAIPDVVRVNEELVSMSRRLGLPLVATNDVHYVDRGDVYAHDVLLCIQTNSTIHDEKRPRMPSDSFYLKSPEEMAALFSGFPEALANTEHIAEMCHLDLEFDRLCLPEVELPPGKTADDFLAELCWQGLRDRYHEATPETQHRLAYELEVIRQTRFASYFLVVWDVISFARKQNILFGVRGSAAASIVLYCLGITDIDPLAQRLVFERFLNLERKEMPDIDLDFQDDRRDEIISYAAQRYGSDRVAQIITFGTLGARAVLRDVGRALGLSYSEVDRMVRLVPTAPNVTIAKAIEESPELGGIYHDDDTVRKLVDTATKLEGIARHASTHAAGVVISKEPLDHYVPLQRAGKGTEQGIAMTQFPMEDIARIGLLKMDFLGLANLTLLCRAREIIAQTRNVNLELSHIPLNDPKTFELLASGNTAGVFQLDGVGMRRYIEELKPTSFSDISAMVALYRPGPKQYLPTFIKAKHGLEPIEFPHPALADILEETYGVIVYQDQVLLIVQAFAGYSLGEADVVRKAMGKKLPQTMKMERQRFLAGAQNKGFSKELAEEVWNLIEPFAGYAFNKAHSVSYAMLAYQTAYLKANYPAEFMAAFLTINMGQSEKVASAIAECHRLGIRVLPPDINKSLEAFTIEQDGAEAAAIRFGLAAIKNVGAASASILAVREQGGPFKSVADFCRRADPRSLNKRALESMIKAGAMDPLGARGALLSGIDRIISLAQREQQLREAGQATMFDLWGQSVPLPLTGPDLPASAVSAAEKLSWEKELLGVCFAEHPFASVAPKLMPRGGVLCGQIDEEMVGQTVVTAGRVVSARQLFTRDKRPFVSAMVEDLDGAIEVTAWTEVYEQTKELWVEGNILRIKGKVRRRGDRLQVSCQDVTLYRTDNIEEQAAELPTAGVVTRGPRRLLLQISAGDDAKKDLDRLEQVVATLRGFEGQDKVYLTIADGDRLVKLSWPDLTTGYCPELQRQLTALVGEEGLSVEGTE